MDDKWGRRRGEEKRECEWTAGELRSHPTVW